MRKRFFGLAFLGLGPYLAYAEQEVIVRTGHAGFKSAAVPLIICAGLALLIDPEFRRPAIAAALYTLGFAGGLGWYLLWG